MKVTPESAAPFVPASKSLATLRRAAQSCEGCDLFRHATQTVFGEGPAQARVVFVGEQPGDKEDLAGEPFVGPAGQILATAMRDAGIDRAHVYVTNAVKHFKFSLRGKRRIHEKPRIGEVRACHPWLDAELAAVQPEVIVCLGATAAQSVLGKAVTISRMREAPVTLPSGILCFVTVHPSSILRTQEPERTRALAGLVADLKRVAKHCSPR